MSRPLPQTELYRLAWLTALRTQGNRQCRKSWRGRGTVCAIALLSEIIAKSNPLSHPGGHSYTPIGLMAGLSYRQTGMVMAMNDGTIDYDGRPQTFAQIADEVASWFPTEKPQ